MEKIALYTFLWMSYLSSVKLPLAIDGLLCNIKSNDKRTGHCLKHEQYNLNEIKYNKLPIRQDPPTPELLETLLKKATSGDPGSRVEYTHWVNLWKTPLSVRRALGKERIMYLQRNLLDETLAKEALWQLGALRGVPEVRTFLHAYVVKKSHPLVLRHEALYAIGNLLGDNQYYTTRVNPDRREKEALSHYLRSPTISDQLAAISAIKRGFILEMKSALRERLRHRQPKEVRTAIRDTLKWFEIAK